MRRSLLLLAILVLLGSCEFFSEKSPEQAEQTEEEYFYSSKKDGDLWRVPLLRPYELVSPTNSTLNDWTLIIDQPNFTGLAYDRSAEEFQFTGIYQVGISDSVIRLDNENEYWPKQGGMYPTTLLINAKTQELFIARTEESKKEIEKQLKEWGVEKMKMHFLDEVKDAYQEKGKLPREWK